VRRSGTLRAPRATHGSFLVAGERDEPIGETRELFPSREARAFPLSRIRQMRVAVRAWSGGSSGISHSTLHETSDMRRSLDELCFRDELTEVLITQARGDEQRDDAAIFHGDLGAHPRTHGQIIFVCAPVESRCPINPVTI